MDSGGGFGSEVVVDDLPREVLGSQRLLIAGPECQDVGRECVAPLPAVVLGWCVHGVPAIQDDTIRYDTIRKGTQTNGYM